LRRKRVLLVVYEFPPEGARGTKRAIKFIKYLADLGWEPVILTVKDGNHDFYDGSLFSEIHPSLRVYRAFTLESLFHRTEQSDHLEVRDALQDKADHARITATRRMLLTAYHFFGEYVRVPDSRILWFPFSLLSGLRIVKREAIDLIFASGPSFTNHIVAAALKKLTGRPLVLDFRDAWASDPAAEWKNEAQARLIHILESGVVSIADRVVSTTEGITNDFVTRYQNIRAKFLTITNGYDLDDFQVTGHSDNGPEGRPFVIVHAGTLGDERSPKEFLHALGMLVREQPELEQEIRVIFVGQNTTFRDGRTIESYLEEYQLGKVVRLTGFVSRGKSIEYMRSADLLLLIIGKVPKEKSLIYGISGKIYDYALAGRFVLAIAEPGASADMVLRLGLGRVVATDGAETIKTQILNCYTAFKNGILIPDINSDLLKAFDFAHLTRRLVACFNVLAP
jgi:glycosyltransferase involved in cell wall biosynthesis